MWEFRMTIEAEGDFARLDKTIKRRVAEKLRWLAANFESATPMPLTGKWVGFFKLRVGDWRIIYDINNTDKIITVHTIGHRSKIYRK